MAAILVLAPELIHRIADYITIRDVKLMRLACRQLGEYLESKILHTVVLNTNKRGVAHSNTMLRSLAFSSVSGAVTRSARHLIIGSLSPVHDPNFWGPISEDVNAPWGASKKETNLGRESDGQQEELKQALINAILSLSNIHSVAWRTEYEDTEWAQTVVASALVSIPHLQRLDAMLAYCRVPLPLQDMHNLREITLSEGNTPSNSIPNCQTFVNLATLIAQSPPGQITRIQASHGYYDTVRTDSKPSLHEILGQYPDDTPLRLRHLGIANAFVKFDERTIPHLKHLTSLDLSNILQPREHAKRRRGRYRMAPQPIDPAVYKSQRTVSSTVDEIWGQLSQLGIWLEQITLSDVVPAFLEYLACYSGLKSLSLRVRGFDTLAESNALALPFFERSLPPHTGSLERLVIEAPYEGFWCFGDHNIGIISACTHLQHLRVSLMTESTKGVAMHTIKSIEDSVDALLGITAHMPQLNTLRLHIANLEVNRQTFCETGALLYYSSATKRIIEHIHRFSVPVRTHTSMPDLYVGPKTFGPGRVWVTGGSEACREGEWKWMYRTPSAEPGLEVPLPQAGKDVQN